MSSRCKLVARPSCGTSIRFRKLHLSDRASNEMICLRTISLSQGDLANPVSARGGAAANQARLGVAPMAMYLSDPGVAGSLKRGLATCAPNVRKQLKLLYEVTPPWSRVLLRSHTSHPTLCFLAEKSTAPILSSVLV